MLLEASESETPQPLMLTATLPWAHEVGLAKEVVVQYTVEPGAQHLDDPIGIRWTPAAGGLYPSFEGEIRVLPDEHVYSSILELDGHYTPPLGVLGARFDAVFGHKVAETTIAHLLEGLASGIVARNRIDKWKQTFAHVSAHAEKQSRVRVVSTAMVVRLALPKPVD